MGGGAVPCVPGTFEGQSLTYPNPFIFMGRWQWDRSSSRLVVVLLCLKPAHSRSVGSTEERARLI
eukprot:scaffold42700_cov28-Tisochrysis_lutea.AAC.1